MRQRGGATGITRSTRLVHHTHQGLRRGSRLQTTYTFSPQPTTIRARRIAVEALVVALLGAVLLIAVVAFYDNTNRGTTNGLWKSINVAPWVEWTPDRKTEDGNLLYYPVIGTMVRALPSTLGPVWRRMAFVNVVFASAVLGLTYLIALRLFESRSAAWFTCLTHAGAAFFLLLATINEDIMPGYAWFVAAMACAVVPRRTTGWTLALAAQFVALSWLFHSSLQLPGIVAIGAGILAGAPDFRRSVGRAAFFGACLLPLPVLATLAMDVDVSAGFWSGKGIGTGWGGFSLNKVIFMWSGIAQYVAGGQNIAAVEQVMAPPRVLWIALTWVLVVALAALFARECLSHWERSEWRIAAAILGSAFVLGEAMNLYVQPQDPQMQLQPMTWFPFAAGAVFWRAERAINRSVPSAAVRGALTITAALLLAVNLDAYRHARHGDSVAINNVRKLESIADPSRTVFLAHGFEGMTTWAATTWGLGVVWPNRESQEPLTHAPRFNLISIGAQGTEFPQRSAQEAADDVVRLVSRAIGEGFDVVATDFWVAPEEQWTAWFDTIAGADKPRAIRAALHSRFTGLPIGSVPEWGTFYRITQRPR